MGGGDVVEMVEMYLQNKYTKTRLFNAGEYKDGEKIDWFTIDSWREIYGEDTIDTLVNNNAKIIYARIMGDLYKS